jgi:hypothetical protein
MNRLIILPTLVFLFSSCGVSSGSQNEASSPEEKKAACSEYVRAYTEEANLDPFAAAAIEALDNPELTSANESLTPMLEQIETDYPGITDMVIGGETQPELGNRFGQSALQAIQDYGKAFSAVDLLIRDLCDAL